MQVYEVKLQVSKRIYSTHGFFKSDHLANQVAELLTPVYEETAAEVVTHVVCTSSTLRSYQRLQLMSSLSVEQRALLETDDNDV